MYDIVNQNRNLYLCRVNKPIMSEDRIDNIDKRIESLETRFTALETKVTTLINVMSDFVKIVNENFTEVKAKIDVLETKIDNLDTNTDKNFKEVKWELKKIQDVTQYADIHANFPPAGQA